MRRERAHRDAAEERDVKAIVLGGGSWGTALSCLLARKGVDTLLWARDETAAAKMAASRTNERYLPGVPFPNGLTMTSNLGDAAGRDVVVAVPTRAQREVTRALVAE